MKDYMEELEFDKLVLLCYDQDKMIGDIRGYDEGLSIEMLKRLNRKMLIEYFYKKLEVLNRVSYKGGE